MVPRSCEFKANCIVRIETVTQEESAKDDTKEKHGKENKVQHHANAISPI
ncbi:hypothetical protein RE6C_00474 [Rhodopirellula europaea 6C]|uniref:Uncharacterized protein n=1 Tax=Rhodopirellula europaea 6C TaxID=1263867 RepID=M2ANU4_9BACT|nr:hypothetical protein RE6C_00474 [Rhodopirellula europaea 6C]